MNKKLFIAIICALSVLLIALLVGSFIQHRAMSEMVEQMEFEKEALEEEYEDLAIQFDGYQTLDIRNDSLQNLLTKEQQRIQDLLEELRITRVTNARRIAELKKELTTVRQVMVGYVHQIDSLNATNTRLTEENKRIRRQNEKMQAERKQIEEQNIQLAETVTRAAMLEVNNFEVSLLNRHDRKTRILAQAKKIEFDFSLARNITSKPGMKTIYLRLVDPKGELLQRNESDLFTFENSEIGYSVHKEIEYAGEALPITMYWILEQEIITGIYNADFFVDGQLIGSFPFELKK